VRYLHYANADKIAPKLKEQMTGIAQAAAGAGGAPGAGASPQAQADKNSLIWADPSNNALIITAPPKIMRQIMAIIDKLDIRRPQVLVEAIIADVNVSKQAELGVNWAAFGTGSNVPAAAFVAPIGGTSIFDLAAAVQNPQNVNGQLLSGTTLGLGRIGTGSVNFAAILRAISSDAHTNIIATPSAITMDDQEAELKVAQEVPFITGSFTNTGAGTGANGQVNPFQTIQREEVGTILKVTPTISAEGTAVMLKLSIEDSNIGQRPAGAVDLVTNKRTVTTNVLVEDGGVLVLGGLIKHQNLRQESRVPILGSIPLIGLAFKTRSNSTEKDNLMIFLRPKILRDASQAAYETDLKYNYLQDQQRSFEHREIPPLLPGERQPRLPALPPPPPNQPPQSPEEQARQSEARRNADDAAERDRQKAMMQQQPPQGAAAPPNPTAPPPQDGGKR
jgi:general secretion pathway protein D